MKFDDNPACKTYREMRCEFKRTFFSTFDKKA